MKNKERGVGCLWCVKIMFVVCEIFVEYKDLIYDVLYDYYGRRMVICFSD